MAYMLIRNRSYATLSDTRVFTAGVSDVTGRSFTWKPLAFPALDLCESVPAPFADWARTTSVPDLRSSEMILSYTSYKVISINLESVEELKKVYRATDLAELHQLARNRKKPSQVRVVD